MWDHRDAGKAVELEMDRFSSSHTPMMVDMLNSIELQFPVLYRAAETGTLERFRTGQPLSEDDMQLISRFANPVVEWPVASLSPPSSSRALLSGRSFFLSQLLLFSPFVRLFLSQHAAPLPRPYLSR